MKQRGILLHISSLPGDYGCGTLGREAYAFVDTLEKGGFSLWQILPLNWPHAGGSPYSSPCTYLQNPLFIDPDTLCEKGLLTPDEIAELKSTTSHNGATFEQIYRTRKPFLCRAAARAEGTPRADEVARFLQGNPRVKEGCRYLAQNEEEVFYLGFLQYEFHAQWHALRAYCHARDVQLIGDLPFYPNLHSSEVQCHKENFLLSADGTPLFESGVPGDRFSDEGQHWGHPLFRPNVLRAKHYAPLLERFLHAATLYDTVRIDHFQALFRYFAIPAGRPVREGRWETGLGEDFLHALVQVLPPARLIAEDLGCFARESRALAAKFDIAPMNVLQFALLGGGSAADFEPHSVAYTGTHDCQTLVGFFAALPPDVRAAIAPRLDQTPNASNAALSRAAIRHLWRSPAARVIFPAQDLLLLDDTARMNAPGTVAGNWGWRLTREGMEKLTDLAPLWG